MSAFLLPLTAAAVHSLMVTCIYTDEEASPESTLDDLPPESIVTLGVVRAVVFHPTRLEENRAAIEGLLGQLPNEFMVGGGGGWSFLNACVTQDGNQWGEHFDMESLFCLGMGIGRVVELMPRRMWKLLPSNMPYYVVDLKGQPGTPKRLKDLTAEDRNDPRLGGTGA